MCSVLHYAAYGEHRSLLDRGSIQKNYSEIKLQDVIVRVVGEIKQSHNLSPSVLILEIGLLERDSYDIVFIRNPFGFSVQG